MERAERGTTKFCVLILEDDIVNLVAVSKRVVKVVPDVLLLSARTIAEAKLLLAEFDINFFLLDIHLPDGSGIDFLFEVLQKNPMAAVVIMTGVPLPEYRDQAAAFGVLNFMEKPVDLNSLGLMLQLQAEKVAGPPKKEDTSFYASLSRLTALEIIQLKCLAKATQVVDFISKHHGNGRIYFRDGEIIHAETTTAYGESALRQIIKWQGGQALEVTNAPPALRSINMSWQGLLLEAAQAADEQGSP